MIASCQLPDNKALTVNQKARLRLLAQAGLACFYSLVVLKKTGLPKSKEMA